MLRAQPSQFLPLSNIKEYDVYYILGKIVVFCPTLFMNGLWKSGAQWPRSPFNLSFTVHEVLL